MFAESMTEAEVNRAGSASDLRYFHTTYGATFGYNERARKYHRSYGLVTPPTNPAFSEYRLGDLATAPLYRRDHLGFRVEYPDAQFTWSDSANKLKKNQKQFGEQGLQRSESPALQPRRVQWRGGATHPNQQQHNDSLEEQQRHQQAYYEQQQRQAEEAYAQRQAAAAMQQSPPPPAPSHLQQNGRAILTSSLAPPSRLATASGPAPIWGPQTPLASSPLTQAERQVLADKANPHRFPMPAFKASPHNPQFDGPNPQQQR